MTLLIPTKPTATTQRDEAPHPETRKLVVSDIGRVSGKEALMAKEFEEVEVDESHPFRTLVKFAVIVGLLYGAGRFLAQKKDEFAGLTESQARSKLMEKMGPRVGEDTAAEIADQVIPKLRDKGLIKSDPMEAVTDDLEKAADDLANAVDQKMDEAADKVAEAVDSVVKD
jgi:hypothetical protein